MLKNENKTEGITIINNISNTTAALTLIDIAYKEGKINEKTYINIQKKYGKR